MYYLRGIQGTSFGRPAFLLEAGYYILPKLAVSPAPKAPVHRAVWPIIRRAVSPKTFAQANVNYPRYFTTNI